MISVKVSFTTRVIGVFITGIPSVMVAAASGDGSAVARDEITFLLTLAVILAVVVAIAALGGNLHRSRRGAVGGRRGYPRDHDRTGRARPRS